jgi:hypothetical protein
MFEIFLKFLSPDGHSWYRAQKATGIAAFNGNADSLCKERTSLLVT